MMRRPRQPPPIDRLLIDQLRAMKRQEEGHYRVADYLPSWADARKSERAELLSWAFQLADDSAIGTREAMCVAASYFDRFLHGSSPRAAAALASRWQFQLAFIACLTIALKCRAGVEIGSDVVSEAISGGQYSPGEVEGMERDVLKALQWRLNGPTPQDFVEGFVRLLPPVAASKGKLVEKLRAMARKRAETAMLDYSMALQPPSSIAYVAIVATMRKISPDLFHPVERQFWMEGIAIVTGTKYGKIDTVKFGRNPSRRSCGLEEPSSSYHARSMSVPRKKTPADHQECENTVISTTSSTQTKYHCPEDPSIGLSSSPTSVDATEIHWLVDRLAI